MIVADHIKPGTLTQADLRALELLLYRETEYLDQAHYDDWLALFTDDCRLLGAGNNRPDRPRQRTFPVL